MTVMTTTSVAGSGSGRKRSRVVHLDPTPMRVRNHQSHALHQGERVWSETNCYVDLWVELLHGYGFDPRAALGFTVTQDFEGDQFTFFKFQLEDLDELYGLQVQELAIFDSLEDRVRVQTQRGNTVLVEVDAFYLPDTRAISYKQVHTKTTIGVDYIDPRTRRLGYFHNTGYHMLEGEDYDGALRRLPELAERPDLLFPYVEFAKRIRAPLTGPELAQASADRLIAHLQRRPARNPITQWRAAFPEHLDTILERGESYFHLYTFNLMRQLGSNFEFLARYLVWLRQEGFDIPEAMPVASQRIASESMVMQFRLVRAIMRKRRDLCDECFDVLEASYDKVVQPLAALIR
jgi:Domain of unknown function (DUF1839)